MNRAKFVRTEITRTRTFCHTETNDCYGGRMVYTWEGIGKREGMPRRLYLSFRSSDPDPNSVEIVLDEERLNLLKEVIANIEELNRIS